MANVSCWEGLNGLSFIQATSLFLPLKLLDKPDPFNQLSFAIVIRIFIKRCLKLFKNLAGYFSIQTPISNGVRELLGTSGVTHLHNRRPRSIHQDFATMFNLPPVSLEIHFSLQGGGASIVGKGHVRMDTVGASAPILSQLPSLFPFSSCTFRMEI